MPSTTEREEEANGWQPQEQEKETDLSFKRKHDGVEEKEPERDGRFAEGDDDQQKYRERRDSRDRYDYPPRARYQGDGHYRSRDDYRHQEPRGEYADEYRRDSYRPKYGYDRDRERGRYDDYYPKRPRREQGNISGEPNETLGIFGLGYDLVKEDFEEFLNEKLADMKGKYTCKLIMNHMTGSSRGYGFVVFDHLEDATAAKDILEGGKFRGREYRVAYSIQGTFKRREDRRETEGHEVVAEKSQDE